MKRFKFAAMAATLLVVLILSGCAYVHTKTPFDTDVANTDLGSKIGAAEAYSILWLVAWGDASYAAAAHNGDITVLKHADQESFSILFGLYVRWRVIVYGD